MTFSRSYPESDKIVIFRTEAQKQYLAGRIADWRVLAQSGVSGLFRNLRYRYMKNGLQAV